MHALVYQMRLLQISNISVRINSHVNSSETLLLIPQAYGILCLPIELTPVIHLVGKWFESPSTRRMFWLGFPWFSSPLQAKTEVVTQLMPPPPPPPLPPQLLSTPSPAYSSTTPPGLQKLSKEVGRAHTTVWMARVCFPARARQFCLVLKV
jgi:hypothetical protein